MRRVTVERSDGRFFELEGDNVCFEVNTNRTLRVYENVTNRHAVKTFNSIGWWNVEQDNEISPS